MGNEITVHTFEGHEIQERITDGYYNATAMCKAKGKEWSEYKRLSTTPAFISKLEGSLGIHRDLLIQVIPTGPNDERGTWVHPRVAVHLAIWADPEFAVAVTGWVMERNKPAPPKHQIPDNLADALLLAGTIEKQRQEAVALIEKQKPYVDAQKRFEAASGSVSIRDAAKHLKINEREFTKLLVEEWRICYRSGSRKELRPKGEYTVARDGVKSTYGYFDLKQSDVDLGNGTTIVSLQMVVTPKGLGAIARKIGPRPGEDQGDLGF